MKRFIALGFLLVGGIVTFEALSRAQRSQLTAAMRSRMLKRMERMMAGLPEGSPPKLVMSILPRLRDQNDEIIRLLREQNQFLREHR